MLQLSQITDTYFDHISSNKLFAGLSDTQILHALESMRAVYRTYDKGEFLHHSGEPLEKFGLILYGNVQVCTDDLEGNRMIMANAAAGQTFGESLCYLQVPHAPIYMFATTDCAVLWLSAATLFEDRMLARRFAALLAERTLTMNLRIQVLSKLTLREKLLTYFNEMIQQTGSHTFTIPLNRNDLAIYIGTNRSALSRELARMQQEGILHYHRNTFTILGHNPVEI